MLQNTSSTPEPIVDAGDRRISFFHLLRGNDPRLVRSGLVLVEGELQVRRLFQTNHEIVTLFIEEDLWPKFGPLLLSRDFGTCSLQPQCYSAPRKVMEQIVGYRLHRGVMALIRKPAACTLDELGDSVVVLNRLVDPENVGCIIRSAVGFGITSFLVDSSSSDPYLRRSVRVSMGAALFIRVAYADDLPAALGELGKSHQILAIDTIEGSVPVERHSFPGRCAFVFGNERSGLAPEVIKQSETILKIPMENNAFESLNVAVSAGIIFHHYFAARNSHPH